MRHRGRSGWTATRRGRTIVLLLLLATGAGCAGTPPLEVRTTPFAAMVEQLSEPGGFFDTDNLISNETSYLHVVGAFAPLGVRGGAYVGVGPDQNFSYIAAIRPEIAYLIDVRRDNLLHHLLFKALFSAADTRTEYLALLLGRATPAPDSARESWTVPRVVAHVDSLPVTPDTGAAARSLVRARVQGFGLTLTEDDLDTVDRFHRTFIVAGLDLRFTTFGRRPQPYYPTYRDLLLERDLTGAYRSFLAAEDSYRFLRTLQENDRIIPVVGDLAGPHALRAIGADIGSRGLMTSALYTSNVEFYLMGDGLFGTFAENLAALPHDSSGVIIRSYFGTGFRGRHPQAVPGYYMTQLLQRMDRMLEEWRAGSIRSYGDLVVRGALPLAP